MKEKKAMFVHIGFIVAILVVLVFAVFKLLHWNDNGGKELVGVETDETFDTEAEDFLAMVNPKHLEGRKDDGKTTIVMLGDDTLSKYRDKDGIAEQVAEMMDATVYNCSFSNTYISTRNTQLEGSDADDLFSLYWVAKAIGSDDYTILDAAVKNVLYGDEYYQDTLKTLKSIDFETVDALTILYGPHDYLDAHLTTDINDPNSQASYTGALKSAIESIQSAYPHIRIVVVSPTFCFVEDADGNLTGADLTNTKYGTLADYMIGAKNIAVMTNVSFLDNYYGVPINATNAEKYLEENIYPNKEMRTFIAERIVKVLKTGNGTAES